MKNKFRVLTDKRLGYHAQIKYWWFPFCYLPYGFNSFFTLKQARLYIADRLSGEYQKIKTKPIVVWQGTADDLPTEKPVYN